MGIRIAGHRTRWAVVVLAVVAATLTGGSAAQAAGPQGGAAAEPRAGVAAWSSFPQIITNFASGKCLQPKAAALNALVEQRTCDTTNSLQKWRSEDAGSGFVRLRNVGSQLCMDLQANSEAEVGNGTLIQVFVCREEYTGERWMRTAGSRAQHFQVENFINTSLCLDVQNRSSSNGALLQLWSCKFIETAQEFKFTDTF